MEKRGWDEVDFVLVTGDAYVDHPSFGTAIISRLLERYGYKVAILPQPDQAPPRQRHLQRGRKERPPAGPGSHRVLQPRKRSL